MVNALPSGVALASLASVLGSDDLSGVASRSKRPLVSSSAVGQANRGRVLQALFDLGPTSRAELARHAGVNRATISGIVQPMIEQRILVEQDPLPSNEAGGKPGRPLWFSDDAQPICAVLLMHDSVHSGLVSLDGTIHAEAKASFPSGRTLVAALMKTVADCIGRTLALAKGDILGIGVAAAGMIDTDRGSIVAVNLAPVLDGFPLGADLTQRFGLPTCVDHHPRALLVGDRWFGRGRGRRNFAVIYTGEVLGGALFLDGHLFRGPAGAGGELGHTVVAVDGLQCRCGQRGCWETIATLGWLRREALASGLPDAGAMDSRRLSWLVEAGVTGAARLLDRYARNLAVGIANLQLTMAPDFMILHGDVAAGGSRMIDAVTAHVRSIVPRRPGSQVELVAGDQEGEAALRGAAGLVLSELLHFTL